jgi:histidinol-phosphate phosphatase family protein
VEERFDRGLRRFSSRVGASGMANVDALLCDRDGTLVADVPYNGDWRLVEPVAGVADALARARAGGLRTAIVTNQSGVTAGLLNLADLAAVHARVEELLGPFDAVVSCPHGPGDGCGCRKPAPGMVLEAARRLGTTAARCLVVGDTAADLAAADAAGAIGVLVPADTTRPGEIAAARRRGRLRASLAEVVDDALGGRLVAA